MAAELLFVPFKKSSDVDIVKPLRNLINSTYNTGDHHEDYTEALNELSRLRANAIWKVFEKTSLDIIYNYHDQLASLESKVPPQEVQIPFKWKDAFDKGSLFGGRMSLTISSLAYERMCILFNIAAMQSLIASQQPVETEESLKQAAKLFQQAAGVFLYLKANIMMAVHQETTPDLHPETLDALAKLMLAQAQEVIAFKCIRDEMKDSMVAKVCAQCDELYTDALRAVQKEQLKSLWERDWLPVMTSKQQARRGGGEAASRGVAPDAPPRAAVRFGVRACTAASRLLLPRQRGGGAALQRPPAPEPRAPPTAPARPRSRRPQRGRKRSRRSTVVSLSSASMVCALRLQRLQSAHSWRRRRTASGAPASGWSRAGPSGTPADSSCSLATPAARCCRGAAPASVHDGVGAHGVVDDLPVLIALARRRRSAWRTRCGPARAELLPQRRCTSAAAGVCCGGDGAGPDETRATPPASGPSAARPSQSSGAKSKSDTLFWNATSSCGETRASVGGRAGRGGRGGAGLHCVTVVVELDALVEVGVSSWKASRRRRGGEPRRPPDRTRRRAPPSGRRARLHRRQQAPPAAASVAGGRGAAAAQRRAPDPGAPPTAPARPRSRRPAARQEALVQVHGGVLELGLDGVRSAFSASTSAHSWRSGARRRAPASGWSRAARPARRPTAPARCAQQARCCRGAAPASVHHGVGAHGVVDDLPVLIALARRRRSAWRTRCGPARAELLPQRRCPASAFLAQHALRLHTNILLAITFY
uniref:BRO1 domain-containing protein n=1 Tax=Heliothis virescens TaxID=7102 RepID=A0A2A4JVF1_HELVI